MSSKLMKFHDNWLNEATIDQLQEKLGNGEVTSKELVLMYLDRIARFDKSGPAINSILEINPDALHIAEALDKERELKGPRGPLHGIPILLKDNIDTHDKMHTSAGSVALANSVALKDSTVAKLLRESGAVILGKTNMTEWANFMTNGMPSGYSSRGGQTLNPYGPGKFNVGGSSAGSGAAVAANLAVAAIGTETSGSILNPSSQNSLVGVKPTLGLISRTGIIPIAHSQDTAGPMTRTVSDAAYLLNALSEPDPDDPITLTNTELSKVDFTAFLQEEGLKDARIGIAKEGYYHFLDENKQVIIDRAIQEVAACGAILIDDVIIPSSTAKWRYDVLTYEFKADINAYLRNLHPEIKTRSLKDIIDYNQQNPEKMLKYGQTVLKESEETSGTLTELEYIETLEQDIYLSRERGIDYVLQKYQLDAILFPHDEGADIAAKAGYPSVTVPVGYTDEGEPVSITFTGTAYSEPTLLKLAYSYEQATKHRKEPKLQINKPINI